jgi:serine protease AprX
MVMKQVVFLLVFCCNSILFSQGFIDPSVRNAVEKDYVVVLKQANTETRLNMSKDQKARFVYNTLNNHAKKSQKEIVSYLTKNKIYFESFMVINAIRVKSNDQGVLNWLSKQVGVEKIIDNVKFKLPKYEIERTESTRNAAPEWGILKIQADSIWRLGYEGQNIVIGGQDTGYDWQVSPLKKKYRGYINDSTANHNYNWFDAIKEKSTLSRDSLNPCGFNKSIPCDDDNHGTHTMGTMVGSDDNNSIGVAPKSQWIGCRNMERGNGSLATYLSCFEWFLAPTDVTGKNPNPLKSPHVINNSWYCSEEEGCNKGNWQSMEAAVNNLHNAGIVVVVSAGNSGPNCNTVSNVPAIFQNAFSVGATAINDTIAGFSSKGPVNVDGSNRMKPDVSAPGRSVRSVIKGGGFSSFSGTSMAGPHVAGTVALILSANPKLIGKPKLVEDLLRKFADPKTADIDCSGMSGKISPNPIYGSGRINALRAVQMARSTVTGLEESSTQESLLVYPNPSYDFINIDTNEKISTNSKLKIISMDGKIIHETIYNNEPINISLLQPNLYIIKIEDNSKIWFGKFIKI